MSKNTTTATGIHTKSKYLSNTANCCAARPVRFSWRSNQAVCITCGEKIWADKHMKWGHQEMDENGNILKPVRLLIRPLSPNGVADCPQCYSPQSVARHNADWTCHKCGYCETVDDDREAERAAAVNQNY